MKILVVSERACIRTLKQVCALSKNNEVHLLTANVPNIPDLTTCTHFFLDNLDSIRNGLRLYKNVDIVYLASEPSWIMVLIKEILPHLKVVMDVHDAQIWRTLDPKYQSAEERLTFRWADGIIVPSESCRRSLKLDKPTLVFPPYFLNSTLQILSWVRKGGVMYEGRIDMPASYEFMNYSKMEETTKAFVDAGIPFHLYVPGKDEKKLAELKAIYQKLGAEWHKGLPYDRLIIAIGFHDWGLCGNIKRFREWDMAMPNKLFEYMCGGIPIIALNARETGRFVEKHGVGISVKTIAEIKDRWDEREECQRNVCLKRAQFSMEKNIWKLEEFLAGIHKMDTVPSVHKTAREIQEADGSGDRGAVRAERLEYAPLAPGLPAAPGR